MSDQWWNHPERRCKDRMEFTELPRGRNSDADIAALIYECFQCPVIKECKADAVRNPPSGGIVMGGERW